MKRKTANKIFILIFVCALVYLLAKPEQFLILNNISVASFCFLVLLSYLVIFVNAWRFRYLCKIFDISLTFTEWFGLTVCTTMYNYFTPASGGAVARAVYLKKKHDLSYSEYASLWASIYWVIFFISSTIAIVLGVVLYSPETKYYLLIIIFSSVLLLGTIASGLIALFFDLSRIPLPGARLCNMASIFSRGIARFKKNRSILLLVCIFCLGFIFLSAVKLYWAFESLGISVSLSKVILIQTFMSISLVISITPGNLGIREGIVGVFSGILGISVEQAIFGALLDRVVSLAVVFFLGFIYSRLLLNDVSEEE